MLYNTTIVFQIFILIFEFLIFFDHNRSFQFKDFDNMLLENFQQNKLVSSKINNCDTEVIQMIDSVEKVLFWTNKNPIRLKDISGNEIYLVLTKFKKREFANLYDNIFKIMNVGTFNITIAINSSNIRCNVNTYIKIEFDDNSSIKITNHKNNQNPSQFFQDIKELAKKQGKLVTMVSNPLLNKLKEKMIKSITFYKVNGNTQYTFEVTNASELNQTINCLDRYPS